MPCDTTVNYVKEIYAPFTDEEISAKMVEIGRAHSGIEKSGSVFEKCFDADAFSYNSRKITSNFTNNSSHFREKMWYDKTVHSFL